MAKLILKGWREGFNKVSLTKLQMELLHMTLKASKENVDALLDNREVILVVEDDSLALDFLEKADKNGVICMIEY